MDASIHQERPSAILDEPVHKSQIKISKRSISNSQCEISTGNEEEGIRHKNMIMPANPPQQAWVPLSILDRFILPIYIPVYFIYDSIPESAFDEFVDKLQSSLAQVLVPYYPFAGRLKKNHTTQSWDIYCDDSSGAEFNVVFIDDELKKTKFCKPCLELRLLAPRIDAVPRDDAIPALAVQVTRFKCGAVALGCSFHHQCGDAHAVSMFMKAWSQLAQGKQLTITPNHSRSTFVHQTSADQQAAPPPVEIVGTESDDGHHCTKSKSSSIEMPSVEEDFGEFAMEGVVFKADDVIKLKAMAPPGSTSFEATTAFVVRHVIKASPAPDDHLAKFVLMVDFRGRLGASDFAGNLALPKAVIVPREAFLSGPLANSVQPIHEAVRGADEAYFSSFVKYAGRGPPRKERALAVSSCARVPLYDVDFGYGGAVFAGINPPVPRLVPEFVLSLPNANKEGFVVYIQLHKDVLGAVMEDPEFMAVAKKYRPLESPSLSRI